MKKRKESIIPDGKRKRSVCAAAVLLLFLTVGMHVQAADSPDVTLGTLYILTTDSDVRETGNEDAAVVGNLPAGTRVVVEGEEGAWSKVIYQELEGYIASSILEAYIAPNEAELEEEMSSVEEEEERCVEEAELVARQRRVSLIWGAVIAILMLTILGFSVMMAVRNAKEVDEAEKTAVTEIDELVIEDMDTENETEEISDDKESFWI